MAFGNRRKAGISGYGASDPMRPLMAGQVAESYSFPELEEDDDLKELAGTPLWRSKKVQVLAGLAAILAIGRGAASR